MLFSGHWSTNPRTESHWSDLGQVPISDPIAVLRLLDPLPRLAQGLTTGADGGDWPRPPGYQGSSRQLSGGWVAHRLGRVGKYTKTVVPVGPSLRLSGQPTQRNTEPDGGRN